MKKISLLAPLAIAASLTLATPAVFAKSAAEWQTLVSQSTVTLEQALTKAAETGKGKVIDIELDDGDGAPPRFETKVVTPTGNTVEVYVNATNGEAVIHKQKGQTKSKDVKRLKESRITIAQAVQAAVKAHPGTPIGAELDSNWGKASYDVEVLQQNGAVMKVKIDAVDSSIIRSKQSD